MTQATTYEPRYDPGCYTYAIKVGINVHGVHYTVEETYLDPSGIDLDRRNLSKPETCHVVTDLQTEDAALKRIQIMKSQRAQWCRAASKYHGISL